MFKFIKNPEFVKSGAESSSGRGGRRALVKSLRCSHLNTVQTDKPKTLEYLNGFLSSDFFFACKGCLEDIRCPLPSTWADFESKVCSGSPYIQQFPDICCCCSVTSGASQ